MRTFVVTFSCWFCCALVSCATARSALQASDSAQIDALERSPSEAGELIYRGEVFDPQGDEDVSSFQYERRVSVRSDGARVSTHITMETRRHSVVVVQRASHDADYVLRSFEEINRQTGVVSHVTVTGRTVRYSTLRDGTERTADEELDAPAVVGPTLFGFIIRNWDTLQAGHVIAIRFVVSESLASYPFTLRRDGPDIVMEGVGIVSLAVSPQRFLFDPQRRIVRFVGRVPPRRDVDGVLSDLDARVEYTHASLYR